MIPGKSFIPLFNAVIDSRSKWFVGSSNINKFAFAIIKRESIHLTFHLLKVLSHFSKLLHLRTTFFLRIHADKLPHVPLLFEHSFLANQLNFRLFGSTHGFRWVNTLL